MLIKSQKWPLTKLWPLAGKFSEFEFSQNIRHFWRVLKFAKQATRQIFVTRVGKFGEH
jgi:hypothetical protein